MVIDGVRPLLLALLLLLMQPSWQQEILLTFDSGDEFVTQDVLPHLNITHIFYKDLTATSFTLRTKALLPNTTVLMNTNDLCDSLAKISMVISAARNPNSIQTLIDVAKLTGIPVIQIMFAPWSKNSYQLDGVTLPTDVPNLMFLVHPTLVFQSSITDILPKMEMKGDILVLRDDMFDSDYNAWQHSLNSLPVHVDYQNLAVTPEGIKAQIFQLLAEKNPRTIIFVAKTDNIETWVHEASLYIESGRLQMLTFTKDITPFQCRLCASVNMFWLRPYSDNRDRDVREFQEFYLRKNMNRDHGYSPRGWDQLDVAFYLNVANVTTRYMMKVNSTFGDFNCISTERTGHSLPIIPFITERKVHEFGNYIEQASGLYYEDVPARLFRIWRSNQLPEEKYAKMMANWSSTNGANVFHGNIHKHPKEITTLTVATILQAPFVQLSDNGQLEGQLVDLMNNISSHLNIKYELQLIPDGNVGTTDTNGIWDGLMGALVSGSADLALGSISATNERAVDVVFTSSIYERSGLAIAMRRSDPGYHFFRFFQMYRWQVWLVIFGVFGFVVLLIWFYERKSTCYVNNAQGQSRLTLPEVFIFVLTSTTRDAEKWPTSPAGFYVGGIWAKYFLFTMFLVLTSNITAYYTAATLAQPITNLNGLLRQDKVQYAAAKGTQAAFYFYRLPLVEERADRYRYDATEKEAADKSRYRERVDYGYYPGFDKFTEMYRLMENAKMPESTSDGLRRVIEAPSDSPFAFIGDALEIEYAASVDCRLVKITKADSSDFNVLRIALALQQGHPLKKAISKAITMFRKDLTLEDNRAKWWDNNVRRQTCIFEEGISIGDVGGILTMTVTGAFAALIVLVIFYCKNKKERPSINNESHELDAMESGAADNQSVDRSVGPPSTDEDTRSDVRMRSGRRPERQDSRRDSEVTHENAGFDSSHHD